MHARALLSDTVIPMRGLEMRKGCFSNTQRLHWKDTVREAGKHVLASPSQGHALQGLWEDRQLLYSLTLVFTPFLVLDHSLPFSDLEDSMSEIPLSLSWIPIGLAHCKASRMLEIGQLTEGNTCSSAQCNPLRSESPTTVTFLQATKHEDTVVKKCLGRSRAGNGC